MIPFNPLLLSFSLSLSGSANSLCTPSKSNWQLNRSTEDIKVTSSCRIPAFIVPEETRVCFLSLISIFFLFFFSFSFFFFFFSSFISPSPAPPSSNKQINAAQYQETEENVASGEPEASKGWSRLLGNGHTPIK